MGLQSLRGIPALLCLVSELILPASSKQVPPGVVAKPGNCSLDTAPYIWLICNNREETQDKQSKRAFVCPQNVSWYIYLNTSVPANSSVHNSSNWNFKLSISRSTQGACDIHMHSLWHWALDMDPSARWRSGCSPCIGTSLVLFLQGLSGLASNVWASCLSLLNMNKFVQLVDTELRLDPKMPSSRAFGLSCYCLWTITWH